MTSRIDKAIKNHQKGYNCSQAVACAYHDILNLDEVTTFKLVEGFGGGLGGLKKTCGAVNAMSMVASACLSDGDLDKNHSRRNCYDEVGKLIQAFENKNGSVICEHLLTCHEHRRHDRLCTSYVEDAIYLLEQWRKEKE